MWRHWRGGIQSAARAKALSADCILEPMMSLPRDYNHPTSHWSIFPKKRAKVPYKNTQNGQKWWCILKFNTLGIYFFVIWKKKIMHYLVLEKKVWRKHEIIFFFKNNIWIQYNLKIFCKIYFLWSNIVI